MSWGYTVMVITLSMCFREFRSTGENTSDGPMVRSSVLVGSINVEGGLNL